MELYTSGNQREIHVGVVNVSGKKMGVPCAPIVTDSTVMCPNLHAERARYCDSTGNIKSGLLEITNTPEPGQILQATSSTKAQWQNNDHEIVHLKSDSIETQNATIVSSLNLPGRLDCTDIYSNHCQTVDIKSFNIESKTGHITTLNSIDINSMKGTFETLSCNKLQLTESQHLDLLTTTKSLKSEDSERLCGVTIKNQPNTPGTPLLLISPTEASFEIPQRFYARDLVCDNIQILSGMTIDSNVLVNQLHSQTADFAQKVQIDQGPVMDGSFLVNVNGVLSESCLKMSKHSVECPVLLKAFVLETSQLYVKQNCINFKDYTLNAHSKGYIMSSTNPTHVSNNANPGQVLTCTERDVFEWRTPGIVNNYKSIVVVEKSGDVYTLTRESPNVVCFQGPETQIVMLPKGEAGLTFTLWNRAGGLLKVISSDYHVILTIPSSSAQNRVVTLISQNNDCDVWGRITDITF